jgi:hypothetical protein
MNVNECADIVADVRHRRRRYFLNGPTAHPNSEIEVEKEKDFFFAFWGGWKPTHLTSANIRI